MSNLTHIERSPLPWRPERLTECGLDVPRHPVWSREEAAEKQKAMGIQRFSLFVCMTCLSTVQRHGVWEHDPASCLIRHAEPMTLKWHGRNMTDEKRRFADELRAIAVLIEQHRSEFDDLVASFGDVVNLAERRNKQEAR